MPHSGWSSGIKSARSWCPGCCRRCWAAYSGYLLRRHQNGTSYCTADRAERRLTKLEKAHRTASATRLGRLTEIQQIAYTGALARDAAANRRTLIPTNWVESDYLPRLHEIDAKTSSGRRVQASELGSAGRRRRIHHDHCRDAAVQGFKHMWALPR